MGSGRREKTKQGAAQRGGAHRAAASDKVTYTDWVWWPNEPRRRSRAEEEFFSEFSSAVQGEMLTRIARLLAGESRFKDVDDLGGGIKELRYRLGNNHYRILFCIVDGACVGLTCFYKNQQKTEKVDLDRAKGRRSSY